MTTSAMMGTRWICCCYPNYTVSLPFSRAIGSKKVLLRIASLLDLTDSRPTNPSTLLKNEPSTPKRSSACAVFEPLLFPNVHPLLTIFGMPVLQLLSLLAHLFFLQLSTPFIVQVPHLGPVSTPELADKLRESLRLGPSLRRHLLYVFEAG
jgi:hypothetical protein